MPRVSNGGGDGGEARLRVRLLGAAEVILDGRRLRAFNSTRLQRFLARIVLRPGPQERVRLAYDLWPDSSERQARTNLRKLLHDFRLALPDAGAFARIGTKAVQWLPSGSSAVDARSFRDAVAAGDFERAALLYKGDLLPACYDDWVLTEREAFRSEALGLYLRLAEGAIERDDHPAAIAHAEAIGALEPADEAAVRIQIRAQLALGRRSAAMRAYDRHAAYLRREFAVAPDAAIEALRNEIGAGISDQTPAPAPETTVGQEPFVGRDAEWKALFKAWRAARAGRARLALLPGEPGIGKSRLAQELGRRVEADGHAVASARAYEAAGRLPWGPVIDLLRSAGLRDRISTLDPIWIAELERLLPELGAELVRDRRGAQTPVAQRHRLFDAVCRAITAQNGAQLLIIDDLQWCDTETIELIGYLVRSEPVAPVLIVGTVRWEELPDHHPLPAIVDALQRDQAVTIVPVEPLDQVSTAALAVAIRQGRQIDDALAERLWRETEGNPLFVVETVRAGGTSVGAHGVLTPTMRAVLRARLGQLTANAQELAELAAVFGRPFSLSAMVATMQEDEPVVADLLDELWRRRIVVEQDRRFDFSHDKLREVALELINPARRRRLHRVVAEAIAHEHRGALGGVAAQLAAHYDQAGLVDRAIEFYRLSGARAVSMSGLDEATASFRRALALLAELPGDADRDALELDIRLALGSPLVALEGYGSHAAHRLYERALALCRKLGKPTAPPVLRGLGLARLQGCRFDDSSAFAQALIDHESGDRIAGTEGRYLMGVSAFWQGDLDKSRRYLTAAIDHYDIARRDEHLALYAQDPKAICLVRLALTTLWSGDAAGARAMARSAAEIAADLDNLMTSAYVVTYGAILATEAEDPASLADLLGQADLIWSRLSERYLRVVLEALRGSIEVRDGRGAGIEQIRRAVTRSRVEGETLHLSYTLLLLARARALRGEWHEARAACREALKWSERCNQRYLVAELLRVDGETSYSLGEPEDAIASLRRAADVSHSQGAEWLELRTLHSLASRFPGTGARAQLAELVSKRPART